MDIGEETIQFTTLRGITVTLEGEWTVKLESFTPDGKPQSFIMSRDQLQELQNEVWNA